MAKTLAMSIANETTKPEVTAALARLLSDSALWRAALGACPIPIAVLDASTPERSIQYVNRAFEVFFGYRRVELQGRSLASALFRGDEPFVHRLLAAPDSRWEAGAWGKGDAMRSIEIAVGAVRTSDSRITSWVVTFIDRSEMKALRAELESIRPRAAA